jgi:hypothetical protein
MSLFLPTLVSADIGVPRLHDKTDQVEMQQTPLEITDHQFVAGTIRQSSADFIFEELLLRSRSEG